MQHAFFTFGATASQQRLQREKDAQMEAGVTRMRRCPVFCSVFLLIAAAALPGGSAAGAAEPATTLEATTPSHPQAAHSPAVTAIGVVNGKTGTQVTISGDADLAYEYFVIEGKSLVVDIPGATSKVWPAEQQVDSGSIGRIQVAEQAGDRPGVRVALGLKRADPFSVVGQNGRIVISFSESAPSLQAAARAGAPAASPDAPAAAVETRVAHAEAPAATARTQPNRVTDISAHYRSNEFRILVSTLNRPEVKRVDADNGTTLRVAILGADMAAPFPRITDYTRMNTPIQSVAAWPEADYVTIEVNLFQKTPVKLFQSEQGLEIVYTLPDATNVPSAQAAPPPPAFLEMGSARPILPEEERNYSKVKIDLDFQDADITEIFTVISSVTKMNIVAMDGVKGKRTVKLIDTPWDQALELLCETHTPQLVQIRESESVIRITTYDQFLRDQAAVANKKAELEKEKAKAEQEKANADAANAKTELARLEALESQTKQEALKRAVAEVERMRTAKLERRTFRVSYGDVEKIGERIRAYSNTTDDVSSTEDNQARTQDIYRSTWGVEGGQQVHKSTSETMPVPKRPSRVRPVSFQRNDVIFEVNKDSKTIFVQDFAENVALMSLVVAALDIPPPAVMVEARIVEVFNNSKSAFGIQWGSQIYADPAHGNAPHYAFPNSISLGGNAVQPSTGINPGNYLVNLPVTDSVSGIGLTLGHIANTLSLDVKLSAMESLGLTKILSNPKVLVLQNKEAKINVGRQLPQPRMDAFGGKTIEWLPVGILLKVTPEITNDGKVIMQVVIEKSDVDVSVDTTEGKMYSLASSKAETRIIIGDGETSVIGGLFLQTKIDGQSSVPGLSKIPFLGWLFKSKSVSYSRSELMIFITPKLVNSTAAAAAEPPPAAAN
jgi:type IV pilus secretin PilQ/predicted competence protein